MSELKVIPLTCPNCGARLEISDDMDRFACAYCGSELTVLRRGGTVSLKPLADAIAKMQKETDKMAAELALQRQEKELDAARNERAQKEAIAQAQIDRMQNEYAARTRVSSISPYTVVLIPFLTLCMVMWVADVILGSFITAPSTDSFTAFTAVISFIIGCLAAGAVIYLFVNGSNRKFRALQREADARKAEIHAQLEKDSAGVDARIRELTAKIDENRRIVED